MEFTYGGIDFKGSAQEAVEFMAAIDAQRQPVPLPEPIAQTELVAPEKKVRPVRTNPDSLFYATDRKKFKPALAETLDYVSNYKKGRSVTDVTRHFGIKRECANQRLCVLLRDGLLERVKRGIYVATYPADAIENATPEQIALSLDEKTPC